MRKHLNELQQELNHLKHLQKESDSHKTEGDSKEQSKITNNEDDIEIINNHQITQSDEIKMSQEILKIHDEIDAVSNQLQQQEDSTNDYSNLEEHI